ncbi:MAG: DNA repair protein RecO [Verrucomicrobium sp.]|nr:DNA repair protein RecO [Verrucomicrobium sp.]
MNAVSEASTPGIVIARMPYGDTGLLVTWATAGAGVMKTMARGALGPKSKLVLDLFYLCEVRYKPSAKSEIAALREARLLHPFLALRRDWRTLLCAQYFADLLAAFSEPHTEMAEPFELLEKALRYLEEKEPHRKLVDRYETRLLEMSGLSADRPKALEHAVASHHHSMPATRDRLLKALG